MDGELTTLAGWLGITPYDLRLRAAAGLPAPLLSTPDAAAAADLLARLRARGHGAVGCDFGASGAAAGSVRELNFGPSALTGQDEQGRPFEVPYVEISGLLRALSVVAAENTVTTKEKKLDVGMAVMTGGLKMSKTVERTTRSASEQREQILYLFKHARPLPVIFRELSVRYQGLGAERKPTTIQNFLVLIQLLRQRAPHALYDERFLTQKRKIGLAAVGGIASERTVTSSNASENELAARLLMLAHEQGQL